MHSVISGPKYFPMPIFFCDLSLLLKMVLSRVLTKKSFLMVLMVMLCWEIDRIKKPTTLEARSKTPARSPRTSIRL